MRIHTQVATIEISMLQEKGLHVFPKSHRGKGSGFIIEELLERSDPTLLLEDV